MTEEQQKYEVGVGFAIKKKEAEVIGTRFDVIEKRAGNLTPALVVADAKSSRSPLHKFFEWDDAKAADKYRLSRAQYLITAIRVTTMVDGQSAETRGFFNVTQEGERFYRSAGSVMEDPSLRAQVVERALRELESWALRYRPFSEMQPVIEAIDGVMTKKTKAA